MSDLRSLIEAAKADAPSTAARAKVWTGVVSAIGGVAASGAVAGSAVAAKMLALGTLLGGALTVGIGGALLFTVENPHLPGTRGEPAVQVRAAPSMMERSTTAPSFVDPTGSPSSLSTSGNVSSRANSTGNSTGKHSIDKLTLGSSHRHAVTLTAQSPDGALAREASLLTGARGALSQGDALSALQIVRKLRALPGAQLVPEELAVEAQALHALGLNVEAERVEVTLRTRFPDSALGR